jgi:sugar phosphate isomerase/epimerase
MPATLSARPKLGTVTYMIAAQWDVPTLIKNLQDCRLEGVELRTTHAHKVEIALDEIARRDVRKRFEDGGIEIAGLGTTCEYQAADKSVVNKNIAETKEWIKLAHDLGCPGVKVRPNGVPNGVPLDDTLKQIGDAMRECAEFGMGYGVHVRVEVHGKTTAELPNIKKIMDHADHENAVVCWNSNDTDLDMPAHAGAPPSIRNNFALVANKIVAVHMRDLFIENYPWKELFGLLRDIGFEGYCFAEIPGSTDPIRVLHYYRALWLAYQAECQP